MLGKMKKIPLYEGISTALLCIFQELNYAVSVSVSQYMKRKASYSIVGCTKQRTIISKFGSTLVKA